MAEQLKVYMCKHFKWTSWNHYGVKMPEYACKLKGGELGSCGGICKKFEPKEGTEFREHFKTSEIEKFPMKENTDV